MRLHKTPKAREMLTRNGPELSQLERRILILCDGRRDLATLMKMLGPEAAASVEVMRQQGYLSASEATPAMGDVASQDSRGGIGLGRGLNRLLRGDRGNDTSAAPDADARPTSSVSSSAPAASPAQSIAMSMPASTSSSSRNLRPRPGARRSISAAKMYMLDMLQLQRSLEASSIAVSIQTSDGEHALVDALLEGLDHLASTTKPSMSVRIAERLAEILPEPHLDALHRCWDAASGSLPGATPTNVIRMARYA